jgi:hypothetical protein
MRSAVYLKWFKEPTVANLSKLNNRFDVAELARLRRQELMLNLSLPKSSKTRRSLQHPCRDWSILQNIKYIAITSTHQKSKDLWWHNWFWKNYNGLKP